MQRGEFHERYGSGHQRSAGLARLLGWLGFLAGGIWLLTALGRGPLGVPSVLAPGEWVAWATGRDAITIVFALLRLIALALAWYLAGTTVIGVVARLVRSSRMTAVADVLAVPAVRRIVQAAFGAGLAAASLTAGSTSALPDSAPSAIAATAPEPALEHRLVDDEIVMTPAPDAQVLQPVADPPVPTATHDALKTWTVQPGDHLWSIAERTLAQAWGHQPSDDETTEYWQRLIARNRSVLTDPGNPDLILPGQVFELPEIPRS